MIIPIIQLEMLLNKATAIKSICRTYLTTILTMESNIFIDKVASRIALINNESENWINGYTIHGKCLNIKRNWGSHSAINGRLLSTRYYIKIKDIRFMLVSIKAGHIYSKINGALLFAILLLRSCFNQMLLYNIPARCRNEN